MKKFEKTVGTFLPFSALKGTNQFSEGFKFLTWLNKTNQNAWQLLPPHETHLIPETLDHVLSPYKGYGVGLDPRYLPKNINFPEFTNTIRFDFIQKNNDWIEDYALFCAVRDKYSTDDWRNWPEIAIKNDLENEVNTHIEIQWKLHYLWNKIKQESRRLKIKIIGDISFYLPLQSPLVWRNQEIFELGSVNSLEMVSGVPDLYNSYYGRQVWGHPLYKLDKNSYQDKILDLFKLRIKYLTQLFDIIRLDHATGFFYYGRIHPTNNKNDEFRQGPGRRILKELIEYIRKLGREVIIDDSANRRYAEMNHLLDKLNIPKSRIFRFAYNEKMGKLVELNANISEYDENIVAYTTTHDSETLMGYLSLLDKKQKKILTERADIEFTSDDRKLAVRFRNAILNSRARVVIIPIQDWLLTKDRINTPGTEKLIGDKNWRYKLNIPIRKLPPSLL